MDYGCTEGLGCETPVTLSTFTALYDNGTASLNWVTQSESNNSGWNIYRGESEDSYEYGDVIQINHGLIEGAGTTSLPTEYNHTDEFDVVINTTYWYMLESVDYSGMTNIYGPISLTISEPGTNPDAPVIEGSLRNYPNPFYPQTEIRFSMPEPANVEVTIYNSKGQKVQTVYNGYCNDDEFHTVWNAENMTSGIYLYVVKVGDNTYSRKMILTK